MPFYHCFHTDLPDQFVEANADRLKSWVGNWPDNPYVIRSRIIDGVQVDLTGKQKRGNWPTLVCTSQRMLDLWMKNKGVNYDGRYWESLAEDQRDPDRKSGVAGGKDALLTSWFTRPGATVPFQSYANRAAGPGLTAAQIQQMYQQAANAMRQQSLGALMGQRNAVWYGVDWAEPPRPDLKRDGIIAGEIVGYRCWKIERGLLRSVYQKDIWLPGQILEGRELGDWDSRGIHAWKDKGSKEYHDYIRGYLNQDSVVLSRHLYFIGGGNERESISRPAMVTGTVFLWGDVVEHDRGWRAEFARVRSLDWLYPDETMMGREQEALDDLRRRYGLTHIHENREATDQ